MSSFSVVCLFKHLARVVCAGSLVQTMQVLATKERPRAISAGRSVEIMLTQPMDEPVTTKTRTTVRSIRLKTTRIYLLIVYSITKYRTCKSLVNASVFAFYFITSTQPTLQLNSLLFKGQEWGRRKNVGSNRDTS